MTLQEFRGWRLAALDILRVERCPSQGVRLKLRMRKVNNMNKLKRLFSPRALATTISTVMLLHSAVTVFADQEFFVSAWCWTTLTPDLIPCTGGNYCSNYCTEGGYYWCCGAGIGGVYCGYHYPGEGYGSGSCWEPE